MATEFDFDELDKAVTSLMKDTEPTPAPPTPDPVQETVTPLAPPPEQVSVEQSAPPAVPVNSQPAVSPAPTAAPKPTGRFMDVVHPSSDMRAPTPTPSREGNNLTPISPTPASTQPIAAPAPVEEPLPSTSSTIGDVPISSPFLPNTQVEKRPLGGTPEPAPSLDAAIAAELGADIEPASEASSETAEPSSTPTEDTTSSAEQASEIETPTGGETSINENAPLPDELSNDLVTIESGEAKPEQQVAEPVPEPVQDTTPAAQLSQSSIPQQYKEETSTSDETHVPIYDDQSTTQPLVHAPKKSGLKVIVIVAVIILLGVIGAVALYFLQFGR